jgi:hypothetical protein
VSCREISIDEFDRITPVIPPTVKRKTNPIAQYIGASIIKWAPLMVAIHLNTLTPVGMAIIMVAEVK